MNSIREEENKKRKSMVKEYGNTEINLYKHPEVLLKYPERDLTRKKKNYDVKKTEWDSQFLTYKKFKDADFIDDNGREYLIAKDSMLRNSLIQDGSIKNNGVESINVDIGKEYGNEVFFIRLPVRLKATETFPSNSERISMFHIATQIRFEIYIKEVIYNKYIRTVVIAQCENVKSLGISNPNNIEQYDNLTNNNTIFYKGRKKSRF